MTGPNDNEPNGVEPDEAVEAASKAAEATVEAPVGQASDDVRDVEDADAVPAASDAGSGAGDSDRGSTEAARAETPLAAPVRTEASEQSTSAGRDRPSRRRASRAAALGARGLLGTAVAAIGALGLIGAVTLPIPHTETASPVVTADPTPGPLALVCPGSFVVAGRDAAAAQKLVPAADFALDTAGASAAGAEQQPLTVVDVGDAKMQTLAATPEPGGVVDLAGAVSTTLAADDAAGFAAAACRPALTESWIAGIDTSVGASGVLLLSNPTDVMATVQLTVFGEAGPSVPAGAQSIVVAPRSTLGLSAAAVVGSEPAPMVLVQSAGAPVQASLQSSLVRGLVATGIDAQTATASAAARQVIPGVLVAKPLTGVQLTKLRMLATESAQSATVTLTPVGKSTPARKLTVDLQKGIPVELPVDGLAAGAYDVTVTGRTGIVAAVWQATGVAAGSDDAWFTAAPALSTPATAAVAGGAPATLTVSNPGADAVTVEVRTGSDTTSVTVPAGGSTAVKAPAGAVSVDPKGQTVHAALTYSAANALAAATVWAPDAAAKQVAVTR